MAGVYTFRFQVFENVTKASESISKGFENMKRATNVFRNSLSRVPNSIDKIEKELIQLRAAQKISFSIKEIRRYGREIRKRERDMRRLNNIATGTGFSIGGIGRIGTNATAAIGAGLTGIGLSQFGGEVIKTLSEFEKYDAVLTNTFGDASVAKTILADITNFAAKTPFQVNELTESFVKLANRGFVPNQNQMTKLGDLAASQGKDFDQLTEALLDAETGEFERLKEFGISASKEGEKVKLAFKGMEKEVKLDNIRDALLEMGNLEGIKGAMDAISKTTGGMLSNMADQWTQLKLSVGKTFAPFIASALPKITTGIEKVGLLFKKNQKPILNWLKILGKVGFAALTLFAVFKGFLFLKSIIAAVGAAIALLTSPVTLIVAAVATAVYLIYSYWGEIKSFMYSLGMWLWNNHPFKFMFDLIDRVFPSFKNNLSEVWEWVKRLFKKAWDWIAENIIKPISGWFGKMFEGYSFDMNLSAPNVDDTKDSAASSSDFYQKLQNKFSTTKKSSSGGIGVNNAIGKIESRSPKNINININKLVESLNLNSTTITEGSQKIKEIVSQVLIQAVNETNYAN